MAKQEFPQADRLQAERGATWMHDDLAEYIYEQTGLKADSDTIRMAFAMRNEYRKTERYANLKEQVKAEKEAEAARVKAEKAAERAKAKAEREAAKAAEKAEKEKAKAEKAAAKEKAEKEKAAANA